jgi:hypothetical protein
LTLSKVSLVSRENLDSFKKITNFDSYYLYTSVEGHILPQTSISKISQKMLRNLDSKVSILKISTEKKKHPNRFQKLISTVDTPMLTYEILDSQPFYLRGTP